VSGSGGSGSGGWPGGVGPGGVGPGLGAGGDGCGDSSCMGESLPGYANSMHAGKEPGEIILQTGMSWAKTTTPPSRARA
jgi:hypothetical protein